MKYFALLVLIALAIRANGQGLLDGFQVVSIPRESVPLGAEWLNGVGPNGEGTPDNNISVNRSLSSYILDKSFKANLDLAIINYLNLNPQFLRKNSINYRNLKIYTVKDLSKTTIRSGQHILYECIKADSITINSNTELDATLITKLSQLSKEVTVSSTAAIGKKLAFSGENLFLAYRIFMLGKSSSLERERKIDAPDMTKPRVIQARIQDYIINFNDSEFVQCVYPQGAQTRSNDNFQECSKQFLTQVEVKNYKSQDMNGESSIKRFKIMSTSRTTFNMSERVNSTIVTDNFEIFFLAEPTFLIGFLSLNKNSRVKLTRITTPITVLRNSRAPGW